MKSSSLTIIAAISVITIYGFVTYFKSSSLFYAVNQRKNTNSSISNFSSLLDRVQTHNGSAGNTASSQYDPVSFAPSSSVPSSFTRCDPHNFSHGFRDLSSVLSTIESHSILKRSCNKSLTEIPEITCDDKVLIRGLIPWTPIRCNSTFLNVFVVCSEVVMRSFNRFYSGRVREVSGINSVPSFLEVLSLHVQSVWDCGRIPSIIFTDSVEDYLQHSSILFEVLSLGAEIYFSKIKTRDGDMQIRGKYYRPRGFAGILRHLSLIFSWPIWQFVLFTDVDWVYLNHRNQQLSDIPSCIQMISLFAVQCSEEGTHFKYSAQSYAPGELSGDWLPPGMSRRFYAGYVSGLTQDLQSVFQISELTDREPQLVFVSQQEWMSGSFSHIFENSTSSVEDLYDAYMRRHDVASFSEIRMGGADEMCWSMQIKRFDPEFRFMYEEVKGTDDRFTLTHPFNSPFLSGTSPFDRYLPVGTSSEFLISACDDIILHLNSYLKSFKCQPSVIHERWISTCLNSALLLGDYNYITLLISDEHYRVMDAGILHSNSHFHGVLPYNTIFSISKRVSPTLFESRLKNALRILPLKHWIDRGWSIWRHPHCSDEEMSLLQKWIVDSAVNVIQWYHNFSQNQLHLIQP